MTMRRFQRRVQDFVCERCETLVLGNGYTDHCPNCLWSKHVDVNPGDREASCGGLMRPIGVDHIPGSYSVRYVCTRCKYRHRNVISPADDFDGVLALAGSQADKRR